MKTKLPTESPCGPLHTALPRYPMPLLPVMLFATAVKVVMLNGKLFALTLRSIVALVPCSLRMMTPAPRTRRVLLGISSVPFM